MLAVAGPVRDQHPYAEAEHHQDRSRERQHARAARMRRLVRLSARLQSSSKTKFETQRWLDLRGELEHGVGHDRELFQLRIARRAVRDVFQYLRAAPT